MCSNIESSEEEKVCIPWKREYSALFWPPVILDTIVRHRDADFCCENSATVHLQTFSRSPGWATGDNQRRTLLQNSLHFWRTLINEVEEVGLKTFCFHRTPYEPMSYCNVLYRSTRIFSRKNSIHDSSFQIKSSI